jgi:hypothetical protein
MLFRVQAAETAAKVRFRLNEDDEASGSNPSDSNHSTDSGVNPTTLPSSLSSAPPLGPPTLHVRQTSTLSSTPSADASLNASGAAEEPTLERQYRNYVDKYLKTKGLRKTMSSLNRLIRGTLRRAKLALERPMSVDTSDFRKRSSSTPVDYAHLWHPHLHDEQFSSFPMASEDEKELTRYGTWNPEFLRMKLPSFRAPYLFLCRIPLDVIHECLKIRLEQKPQEPSELSIRQVGRSAQSD